MQTTVTNGRTRKSLADQIDRLDGILDGLAEALNESVTGAVREAAGAAVREAVRGVLTELLSNPGLLQRFCPAVAPADTPASGHAAVAPGLPGPIRKLGGRLWAWGQARLLALRRVGQNFAQQAARAGAWVRHGWCQARQSPLLLLASLAAGVAAAAAAMYAGPWLAVALSGLGGCATALATHVSLGLRRLLGTALAEG
jgi:hypothetical protein